MTQLTLNRPPMVRVINGVGSALSAVGVKAPEFSIRAIERAAIKTAGHDDFGSDSYLAGLEPLLYSLEHEAKLHQLGRLVLHRQTVSALASRLAIVAWEKANPELAKAEIKAPMVVMGLPRTGTTILYEMLAADPSARAPLTWECRDFALAHEAAADPENDPRIEKLGRQMAQVDKMMPGFTAIHHFGPFIPTECIGLTLLDIASEQLCALAWLPTYRKFLIENSFDSAYHWHKRGLRYLQATQPDKTWVLKTPMHAGYLPAFFAEYPDAQLIHTHRDPLSTSASVASLYNVSRSGWSDHVDVKAYAPQDAAYYAEMTQRVTAFRANNPDKESQFCDIGFKDFMSDPMPQIRKIYSSFRRDLTDATFNAIDSYLKNRPQDKYGRHKYDPADFGFSREGVDKEFADYIGRFGEFVF